MRGPVLRSPGADEDRPGEQVWRYLVVDTQGAMALADSVAMFGGAGQGGRQLVGLLAAFVLSGIIGLEREIAGKSAGLRTQTIVGTSAALILLVSKYGFDEDRKSVV